MRLQALLDLHTAVCYLKLMSPAHTQTEGVSDGAC